MYRMIKTIKIEPIVCFVKTISTVFLKFRYIFLFFFFLLNKYTAGKTFNI